jgi:hypothetical protein
MQAQLILREKNRGQRGRAKKMMENHDGRGVKNHESQRTA